MSCVVIPFEAYKHTLPQPFWCEHCDKKGHLKEFRWQALKRMPKHVQVSRPKPKSVGKKGKKDRVKLLVSESKRIINELKALVVDDDSRVRQAKEHGKDIYIYIFKINMLETFVLSSKSPFTTSKLYTLC